jgi:anti-anti-sigma factor
MHQPNTPIRLEYRTGIDCDGAVRLALLGEIDIAVADDLAHVLEELEHTSTRARLDLSELRFIDLGALDAILGTLAHARRTGWKLEVDACVSPIVARLIALTGVEAMLWPAMRRRRDQAWSERRARCSASSPGAQP